MHIVVRRPKPIPSGKCFVWEDWEGFSSTSKTSPSAFGGNCMFEIHCSKCLMEAQNNGQGLKAKDFFVPVQIEFFKGG